MTRWRVAWAALAVLGCGGLVGRPPEPARVLQRAPGPVAVRFSSDVPDPYEVLSGPIESYRRVRVNGRLAGRLDAWSREKAGPAGGPALEVRVHLARIATSFERLGFRARPAVLVARASRGAPAPADAGAPVFAGADREDGDDSRPEQITKVVEVDLTVEVARDGQTLRSEPASVVATEILERRDIRWWSYDYADLLDEALRRAVEAVDAAVERALGRSGGPP